MTQRNQAERLRELHQRGNPLVLVNAWDAASARVAVRAGAQAVATSSAAAAYSLGYPDGQRIPRQAMVDAVAVCARAVDVPVTADMEAGYGDTWDDAALTARGVVKAGAVGLNLEDTAGGGGLLPVERFVEKIEAVHAVAKETGVPLVLNARTDVYIGQIGEPDERLEHAVERGRAYLAAGADCVFVPAVIEGETIDALVRGIDGPVSVLATAGSPSLAELTKLGVVRVSMGSGPYRAALSTHERIALEAYGSGTFSALSEARIAHADAQQLLA